MTMSQRAQRQSTRIRRDLEQSHRPSTSQRLSTCQRPSTRHRGQRDSSSEYDDSFDSGNQSRDELRENEKKTYALAVCKYILAMTKKKLPIKSADVVKNCMRGETRLFPAIFEAVSEQLSTIYGLDAHEIRDEKMGKIILCSSTVSAGSEYELTVQQRVDMQLLYIVLSYIHMKGDVVAEPALFGFLKRLGLHDEPHEQYGNFKKKIIETFPRQLYLKRVKIQVEGGNAEDKIQYSWGRRAQLELTIGRIVESVAEIFQVSPNALLGQSNETIEVTDEVVETSDIELDTE